LRLFRRIDVNADGRISFSEFRDVLLHVPDYSLSAILGYWERAALLTLYDESVSVNTHN
jgi:Ca2+-binding EF-hand superfamily protein